MVANPVEKKKDPSTEVKWLHLNKTIQKRKRGDEEGIWCETTR